MTAIRDLSIVTIALYLLGCPALGAIGVLMIAGVGLAKLLGGESK